MATIQATRLDELLQDRNAAEVARSLGLQPSLLSKLRRGRIDMDPDKIRMICRYFDVSSDWLLGLSDERRSSESDAAPLVDPDRAAERALEIFEERFLYAIEVLPTALQNRLRRRMGSSHSKELLHGTDA